MAMIAVIYKKKLLFQFISENDEIVELLIKNGADVNIPNKNGQTALNWAASTGNIIYDCL